MFIVILNYIKSLDEVDEKRNEHLSFINNYVLKVNICYKRLNLICKLWMALILMLDF